MALIEHRVKELTYNIDELYWGVVHSSVLGIHPRRPPKRGQLGDAGPTRITDQRDSGHE
jgi:hypothetical protein